MSHVTCDVAFFSPDKVKVIEIVVGGLNFGKGKFSTGVFLIISLVVLLSTVEIP